MPAAPRTSPRIAVIGAGFGGIGMAIRLRRAGVTSFAVFERGDGIGGVWRDNTYPGAACDVPSHLYSFSFAPDPAWTRSYAGRQEILDYLERCARVFGVTPHIRFGTEVTEAAFDDASRTWRLTTAAGATLEFDVVVSACGQLRRPAYPDIPGRADFAGEAFHSARWNHDTDLDGKDVAVIGTGASAIQFVPRIAERVGRLRLFQRSPAYVLPKDDRPYSDAERARFAGHPLLLQAGRAAAYVRFESRVLAFQHVPSLMRLMRARFLRHLRHHVPDPELRARLTPDYTMGCKRILLSNDFYAALTRPNVDLVDRRVHRIEPDGVATADGTLHPADVIIYGTGFTVTDFLAPMRVTGRGGRDLGEAWRDGAEAHLGITVAGFPNLFLLYGPNTNLGHNSIIYMLESQIRYVMDAVRRLSGPGHRTLDVRPDAQARFVRRVRRSLEHSVWATGCDSWYVTDTGAQTVNWPGFTWRYRQRTRRLDPRDYVGEIV
ncbi:cation diffusion facilitator CzcD-associated flavoprotein CzcO [Nocardiopsis mwathae]|uniref:Cation diffusion facilitator CzcD-associated flavoprotein CzcO n=1 Tax=Nocardiopsis mwathae TaxID=1472723 RepID=A0A7X0D670_9ACTN|nr:NAD(P)/FAD-dependent oxidoreductase [Nocardiopsis mwathae]MBB6172416.1 cation diffusion facilitator CzcD-associated flavoprotein CzcO [Nocardiopsis mwathae]